ncbi:MAG: hypothetical protein N3A38_17210, partial [Planctomycetota bacterium]|nr:hypothetical protein [Planctomycetota bacterium]
MEAARIETGGALGGRVIDWEQMKAFADVAKKEGFEIVIDTSLGRPDAPFGQFAWRSYKIVFNRTPTRYMYWHEWCHLQHYREVGRQAFARLS